MQASEKSEISRELILAAAIQDFSKYGYEGASMRRICKESGVSNGRLFHHFKDKQALYLACGRSIFEMFATHIETFNLDISQNLEENSLRLYMHWQNFWRIHPETDEMTIQMRLNPPVPLRSEINAILRQYFVGPLKRVLHDMFSFYYPNDPKQQSFLTGVWLTVLDYTFVGIGLPKADLYATMEDWLQSQYRIFHKMLTAFLYGLDSDSYASLQSDLDTMYN